MSKKIPLSNITPLDIVDVKPYMGFRSVPNTVVYDVTKGRSRKLPLKFVDNEDIKISYNKRIKDLSEEQLRTYNRLAQRKTYAKKQAIELSGETAAQYKKKLGKTIKEMTKAEKTKYNRLSKREQRLRK